MLLVRSFFEVDVMNPYMLGSFLLYYSAGLLVSRQHAVLPDVWRSPRLGFDVATRNYVSKNALFRRTAE